MTFTIAGVDQLASDVFERALARPGDIAFWIPHAPAKDPRMRAVTAREFAERVTDLAAGLIAAGVAPGDRIGLMAPPGFDWALCDYAIWTAGAVTVPADEHDAAHLFHATGAVAVITRDHATATRALTLTLAPPTPQPNLRPTPPARRAAPPEAHTVPPGPRAASAGSREVSAGSRAVSAGSRAVSAGSRGVLPGLRAVWSIAEGDLERLADGGAAVPQAVVDARRRAIGRADPATIVSLDGSHADAASMVSASETRADPATMVSLSGRRVDPATTSSPGGERGGWGGADPATTSSPGGERGGWGGAGYGVLTHGALRDAVRAAGLPRGASVLLHRPLTRLVPRLLQLGAVHHGCRVSYEPDPGAVPGRIRSLGPSVLLATPRLLAELLELARAEAYADGRGALFARAEQTAVAYGRALANGGAGRWLRAERRVFDRLCYARLRSLLGGRVTHLVCDGLLDEPLSALYRGAGLTLTALPAPTPTLAPAPAPAISA